MIRLVIKHRPLLAFPNITFLKKGQNLEKIDEFPRVLEKVKEHKDQIPKDSTIEEISEILNFPNEEDD